jgi:hypothetical protein
MIKTSWLPPIVLQASERLRRAVEGAVDFSELAGSTVWLAVTGLSRSGKSVFTTSLIHNLLSAAHNPHRMPLFEVVAQRRLIAATLEGARAQALPRFPYRQNVELMASCGGWPKPTDDISEIGVEIHFTPAGHVGRLLGELRGGGAAVTLRLVDYPGEWLIDLPLIDQSYAQWSRATLALWRQGVRAEVARDYFAFLGAHRADERASEETARQAHDLYRACLIAARDRHGLSFLQPGRFLCPGGLPEAPYLWFAPLDLPAEDRPLAPHALGALMAERFEAYKREAVARFYEEHFRHYRRQIVLVDVLRALLAGRDAFEDARLALDAVLASFRYGHGGLIARLLNGPHIDKVLFAATKADHVPDLQREHLAALLRNMVALPALEVMRSHAQMEVAALASVISTAEATEEIDGRRVPVVVGRPVGAKRQAKFFVGTVPIKPPRPDQWDTPFLDVPVFEPPAIDPSPIEGIAHINLDSALEFLLGDRLR